MFKLLRLPDSATLLANNIGLIQRPYAHGQALIVVRLDDGSLIEATWDDEKHWCTVIAYEMNGDLKVGVISERSVMKADWLPGIVNALAWELTYHRNETRSRYLVT